MVTQQDFFPPDESAQEQLKKKLILLYLINKFDIPLSGSAILQFALDEELLNFSQVQLYLNEMEDIGYIDKSSNNSSTHYTITDDGVTALESFTKSIPNEVKAKITKFAGTNRSTVKKDFQNIANYFFDRNSGEYVVKCGVYEDDMMLMEINLSVVSKDQALSISTNWNECSSTLYGEILNLLLTDKRNV